MSENLHGEPGKRPQSMGSLVDATRANLIFHFLFGIEITHTCRFQAGTELIRAVACGIAIVADTTSVI